MKSVLTLTYTYRTYLITTLFAITLFVLDTSFAFAGVLDDIAGNIMGGFATVIGGGVLLIGGLLLDNSINILVVGMGSFLNGSFGVAVNNLWVVIRDVFNILFIFGLIYIGIKTILNSDSSNTQRTLVNLIIAALFINFSLYITQAIVDMSNILSLQIYNQITTSGEVNVFDVGTIGGISGVFMQASNLTSLFGLKTSGFFYAFFTLWFFIIAGLVFAWGAILLVTRFVALVLYMIFSPIMFLGWILPSLSSYTKKWWGGFLKQCFFAPAFLFMLFLSVVVLDTLSIQGKSGTGFFGMFLSFAVIIGFLIASIRVAQMAGAYGSNAAMGSLKAIGNGAKGAVVGGAYRFGVGNMMRGATNIYDRLDRTVANTEGRGKMTSFAAKAVRGVMGGEAGRRAVVKARDAGVAGSMGRADVDKMNRERTTRASRDNQIINIRKSIKATEGGGEDEQMAMERMVKDASGAQLIEMMNNKDDQALIMKVAGELSDSQVKSVMDDKELNDGIKTELGANRGEQISKRLIKLNGESDNNIGDVIHKADASELKALGFKTVLEHADRITSKQIEDWKDLTTTEKTRLKENRKTKLELLAKEIATDEEKSGIEKIFERFTNDVERSKLPKNILTDKKSTPYLNTKVLAKLIENDGLSSADRDKIKNNMRNYYGVDNLTKNKEQFEKNEKWFRTPLGQLF